MQVTRLGTIAFLFALLAAALRFAGLGDKPFWIAEIQEFVYAYRGSAFSWWEFSAGDFLGFLYHKMCFLLGLSPLPFTVRLLSALAGILLPPALFLLMARSGRVLEAAIVALLSTFSLPLLQASQEGRFYAGMTLFLSISLLLETFGDGRPGVGTVQVVGKPRAWLVGLLDAAAILCHPYAGVWIFARYASCLPLRPEKSQVANRKSQIGWLLLPPLAACCLQALQLLSAADHFRLLHTWFRLEEYPPGLRLFHELVAHMGVGTGIPAVIAGLLVLAGLVALSELHLRASIRLAIVAFAAPLLLTALIYVAGARFSFTHMLPAAVPLYVLASFGITGLARFAARSHRRPSDPAPGEIANPASPRLRRTGRKSQIANRLGLLLLLSLALLPMARLSVRYLQRPTRLELGADVSNACRYLATHASPGDAVITTYDKYFTAFSFYCGPELDPGVRILAPAMPADPWIVGFNHLFPSSAGPFIQPERVSKLDAAAVEALPSRANVFLVVPLFEQIEGRFSETVGWYSKAADYGPASSPSPEDYSGWRPVQLPLLILLQHSAHDEPANQLVRDVTRILEARRPLF